MITLTLKDNRFSWAAGDDFCPPYVYSCRRVKIHHTRIAYAVRNKKVLYFLLPVGSQPARNIIIIIVSAYLRHPAIHSIRKSNENEQIVQR